jgi:hypothetical protein
MRPARRRRTASLRVTRSKLARVDARQSYGIRDMDVGPIAPTARLHRTQRTVTKGTRGIPKVGSAWHGTRKRIARKWVG